MKPLVFTEILKQDTCIHIADLQQKVTHLNAIILQFKKERNTLMNITDVFTNRQRWEFHAMRISSHTVWCSFQKNSLEESSWNNIFCLLISEEIHFIEYSFCFLFWCLLNLNFFIYLKHIEIEYAWRKFHMRFTSLKKGLLRKLNKYPCQFLSIKTNLK